MTYINNRMKIMKISKKKKGNEENEVMEEITKEAVN